ncbi:hypothetical protein BESB_036680 [Besnoitia besnoiti]|uniref:Uncharacterized protein n=1 Tax=Besnoitia besnoiti TaxID=94643 RepID=A0A2A9MNE9_BESBE|nr:hypothetical protein BESB_036680 [Besnoitia besnoiti]PFH37210.1 hypothetical protein BESB_036680 [Besnoitia besnoiti]
MADIAGNSSEPPSPLSAGFSEQRGGVPSLTHPSCPRQREDTESDVSPSSPCSPAHASPSSRALVPPLNTAFAVPPQPALLAASPIDSNAGRFRARPVVPQLRLGLPSASSPQAAEGAASPASSRASPSCASSGPTSDGTSPCNSPQTAAAAQAREVPPRDAQGQHTSSERQQDTWSSTSSDRCPPMSPSKRRCDESPCASPSSLRALPAPVVWWSLPLVNSPLGPQLSSRSAPQSPSFRRACLPRGEEAVSGCFPSYPRDVAAEDEPSDDADCAYTAITTAFHDQIRFLAASSPALLAAVDQVAESAVLCRLEPVAAGAGVQRTPAYLSSLRRQHALVLLTPSPQPEAFSIQNLLQTFSPGSGSQLDAGLVESLREQLASQEQRFEDLFAKDISQGELRRDLWRTQLLEMQHKSQLRKQTEKICKAVDLCASLASALSGDSLTSAGAPSPQRDRAAPPASPGTVAELCSGLLCLLREAAALGQGASAQPASNGSAPAAREDFGGFQASGLRDVPPRLGALREEGSSGARHVSSIGFPSPLRREEAGAEFPFSPSSAASRPSPPGSGLPSESSANGGLARPLNSGRQGKELSLSARMQTQQAVSRVPPLFRPGEASRMGAAGGGAGLPLSLASPARSGGGRDTGELSRRSLSSFSCSSYCSSRSNLTTHRGNNSGDEGSGPPSGRGRVSSGIPTAFLSKWKGRPAFVPRLNLTGDDSDEEEEEGDMEDAQMGAPAADAHGGGVDGAPVQEQARECSADSIHESGFEMRDAGVPQRVGQAGRLESDMRHQAAESERVCPVSTPLAGPGGARLSAREKEGNEAGLGSSDSALSSPFPAAGLSFPSALPQSPSASSAAAPSSLETRSAGEHVAVGRREHLSLGKANREKIEEAFLLQQQLAQARGTLSGHQGAAECPSASGGPLGAGQGSVGVSPPLPSLQPLDVDLDSTGAGPCVSEEDEKQVSVLVSSSSESFEGADGGSRFGFSVAVSSTERSCGAGLSGGPTSSTCNADNDRRNLFGSRQNIALNPSSGSLAPARGVTLFAAPGHEAAQASPRGERQQGGQEKGRGAGGNEKAEGSRRGQPLIPRLALGETSARAREPARRGEGAETRGVPPRVEGQPGDAPVSSHAETRLPAEETGNPPGGAEDRDAAMGELASDRREVPVPQTQGESCDPLSPVLSAAASRTWRPKLPPLTPTAGRGSLSSGTGGSARRPRRDRRGSAARNSTETPRSPSVSVSSSSVSSPSVAEIRRAFENRQVWSGSSGGAPPTPVPSPGRARLPAGSPGFRGVDSKTPRSGCSSARSRGCSLSFSLEGGSFPGRAPSSWPSGADLTADEGVPKPQGGLEPNVVAPRGSGRPRAVPRLVGLGGGDDSRRQRLPSSPGGGLAEEIVPAFSRTSLFPSPHSHAGGDKRNGSRVTDYRGRRADSGADPACDDQGEGPLEGRRALSPRSDFSGAGGPHSRPSSRGSRGGARRGKGGRGPYPDSPCSREGRLSSSRGSYSPPSSPSALFQSQSQQPRQGAGQTSQRSGGRGGRRAGGARAASTSPSSAQSGQAPPVGDGSRSQRGEDTSAGNASTPLAFPARVVLIYEDWSGSATSHSVSGEHALRDAHQQSEELRCLGVDPTLVLPRRTAGVPPDAKHPNFPHVLDLDFASGDAEGFVGAADLMAEAAKLAQRREEPSERKPVSLASCGLTGERAGKSVEGASVSPLESGKPPRVPRLLLPALSTGGGPCDPKRPPLAQWDERLPAGGCGEEGGALDHAPWLLDGDTTAEEESARASSQPSVHEDGRVVDPLQAVSAVAVGAEKNRPQPPAVDNTAAAGPASLRSLAVDVSDFILSVGFEARAGAEGGCDREESLDGLLTTTAPGAMVDGSSFDNLVSESASPVSAPLVWHAPEAGAQVWKTPGVRATKREKEGLEKGEDSGKHPGPSGVPNDQPAREGEPQPRLPQESKLAERTNLPQQRTDSSLTTVHEGRQQVASTEETARGLVGPGVGGVSPGTPQDRAWEEPPSSGRQVAVEAEGAQTEAQRFRATAASVGLVPNRVEESNARGVSSAALLSALLNPLFSPLPADLRLLLSSGSESSSGISTAVASESASLSFPLPGDYSGEGTAPSVYAVPTLSSEQAPAPVSAFAAFSAALARDQSRGGAPVPSLVTGQPPLQATPPPPVSGPFQSATVAVRLGSAGEVPRHVYHLQGGGAAQAVCADGGVGRRQRLPVVEDPLLRGARLWQLQAPAQRPQMSRPPSSRGPQMSVSAERGGAQPSREASNPLAGSGARWELLCVRGPLAAPAGAQGPVRALRGAPRPVQSPLATHTPAELGHAASPPHVFHVAPQQLVQTLQQPQPPARAPRAHVSTAGGSVADLAPRSDLVGHMLPPSLGLPAPREGTQPRGLAASAVASGADAHVRHSAVLAQVSQSHVFPQMRTQRALHHQQGPAAPTHISQRGRQATLAPHQGGLRERKGGGEGATGPRVP